MRRTSHAALPLLTALALAAAVPASLSIPTASAAHCYVTGLHEFPVTKAEVFLEMGDEWESVDLHGPTLVLATAVGDTDGDGREEMDTQIVEMSLVGESSLLGGRIEVAESPARPTLGKIEQGSAHPGGGCFPATSYFDVFVDVVRVGVEGASGLVHNDAPIRMSFVLSSIPPARGDSYVSASGPIALHMGPSHPDGAPPPVHDVVAHITHARHTPVPVFACSDGADNDGDGRVDAGADWGCFGPQDDTESPDPACSNGADDDADGDADFPGDAGCTDPWDQSEDGSGVPRVVDCTSTQNPHPYFLAGMVQFATTLTGEGSRGTYTAHDLCTEGFDGDYEFGVGGGFLPAGIYAADPTCDYGLTAHHGPNVHVHSTVPDESAGALPDFAVGSDPTPPTLVPSTNTADDDGFDCLTDGAVTPEVDTDDCIEDFTHVGTTTCLPGGDGGWHVWVKTAVAEEGGSVGARATLQGAIHAS